MTPAVHIALGLFFLASGGFVVVQGLRARRMNAGPWPRFFAAAFVIHLGIAVIGLFLVARGLIAITGG
jgi:hypothetical protein